MHGGWVAFAIFVFIILIIVTFGLIEDAKEKQKSKPQMTYPPKKDNVYSEKIVLKNTDNSVGPILATLAGIIVIGVPLTILYFIAIQF
mgnify:CR=1 FL=1